MGEGFGCSPKRREFGLKGSIGLNEKKITKPEIQKYLVVSTAHASPDDMERLKGPSRLSVDQYESGTCIHIPGGEEYDLLAEMATEEFSDSLIVMAQLAKTLGCQFLKLDEDGPVMDGYPVHDWG